MPKPAVPPLIGNVNVQSPAADVSPTANFMVSVPPADIYNARSPMGAVPMSYVLSVFIAREDANDPVIVRSSELAFPSTTLPLRVATPATVNALILKSLVPSLVPLMMSVKLVFRVLSQIF